MKKVLLLQIQKLEVMKTYLKKFDLVLHSLFLFYLLIFKKKYIYDRIISGRITAYNRYIKVVILLIMLKKKRICKCN